MVLWGLTLGPGGLLFVSKFWFFKNISEKCLHDSYFPAAELAWGRTSEREDALSVRPYNMHFIGSVTAGCSS